MKTPSQPSFFSGKSLIWSVISNVCSEGGQSKDCLLCLADGFTFLCMFGLTAWLVCGKSWISCAEKYPSFSYSEAVEKNCLWVEFFPYKRWALARMGGGEWAALEAISWLKAAGPLNSCESVLWDTVAFLSAFISCSKWGKCLCKGWMHQQISSGCPQSYDQLFVSQLCCMPSIPNRNICSKLISNSLTSFRQTQ